MQETNTNLQTPGTNLLPKVVSHSLFYQLLILLMAMVPAGVFAQDASSFIDVTGSVQLFGAEASSVIGMDVNNDNYPDLLTLGPVWKLYLNEQRPGSGDPKDRVFVQIPTPGLDAIALKDFAAAADFNNDGNIDILTNRWYHTTNGNGQAVPDDGSRLHILLGDGHGGFTLKENSGLEDLGPMAGVGLPMLDYDRDGNLDLYVANHYVDWFVTPGPSYFMKGNGDGTFTNMTIPAGINISEKDPAKPWLNPPQYRPMFGANMSDWNNDCWPDIFSMPYESVGYPEQATHCEYDYGNGNFAYAPCNLDTQNTRGYAMLYKNNGNGTFTDKGVSANLDSHFAWSTQGMVPWAAMPGDYNNDGNIDFLVLEVHGANYSSSPAFNFPAEPGNGRTCIFTNMGPDSAYKLSYNVGQIVRVSPQSSSHGDHNGFWSDFDNDGWLDLVVGDAVYEGTTDRMAMCHQDPSTHIFTDIMKPLGFIANNSPTSIAFTVRRPSVMIPIDYDMDGDDDIIKTPYSPGQDSLLVLRNDWANKNNHIEIKLVAPDGVNRSCIGARITVKAGGFKQTREVYGDQGSQTNEYPFTQNFGIGQATTVDTVDIRWPDANCSHTIIVNPPVNKFVFIGGTGIVSAVNTPTFVKNNLELYPNPTSANFINLSMAFEYKATVEVYNTIGAIVGSYNLNNTSLFQIPIANLPAGLYWVRVIGVSNGEMTKSFVKAAQ